MINVLGLHVKESFLNGEWRKGSGRIADFLTGLGGIQSSNKNLGNLCSK